MVVDYDLVVVGGTLEAREAAWLAIRTGARVALVASAADWETGLRQALTAEILRTAAQAASRHPFEPQPPVDWAGCREQLALAQTIAYPHLSRPRLSELGVDLVVAAGQFSPKPQLAFTTAERRLTARAYLVATGGQPRVPAIPGLNPGSWRSPATLLAAETQPQRVIVLGGKGTAVATAQILARLGSEVTLVAQGKLLPDQDQEISQLAHAQLMAAGVQVQLHSTVESVQQGPTTVRITTQNGTHQGDQLILATGLGPDLKALNLDRILGGTGHPGLAVDPQLRTRHRQIYACGPVLGGSADAHLARHEAQVAVRNALYLPRRAVCYRIVPEYLPTLPAIARVGLTEAQASQYYGTDARAFTQSINTSLKAHLKNETSGFCKLIVHNSGEILGAHWLGPQADEIVQTVALMMHQGIRCQQLNRLPALPYTFTELLKQVAQQWQQQRWQPGDWRRDWSENWFNWRRTRQ